MAPSKRPRWPRTPQKSTPAHKAFRAFLRIVGNQTLVARRIGVSQPQVSRIDSRVSSVGFPCVSYIEQLMGIPALAWSTGEKVDIRIVKDKARALRDEINGELS
jgi:hypothetical protein